MAGAEAERGQTRVDIVPVVVMVCYVQLALVLGGIAVAVADKRPLPLWNDMKISPTTVDSRSVEELCKRGLGGTQWEMVKVKRHLRGRGTCSKRR